jgi:hypothetical protein
MRTVDSSSYLKFSSALLFSELILAGKMLSVVNTIKSLLTDQFLIALQFFRKV